MGIYKVTTNSPYGFSTTSDLAVLKAVCHVFSDPILKSYLF
jgi:hypothetical protein